MRELTFFLLGLAKPPSRVLVTSDTANRAYNKVIQEMTHKYERCSRNLLCINYRTVYNIE